jgi:flagellar protein FlbD
MITLHRLNGEEFVLNAELIQTVQGNKETLIVLSTGNQLLVRETKEQVAALALDYRKRVAQEAVRKSVETLQRASSTRED